MPPLKITLNAGFFSCCTIRLIQIMQYYNANGVLPESVDSSEQFAFYKGHIARDITHEFFAEDKSAAIPEAPAYVTFERGEVTFSDYSKLFLHSILPFVQRYFTLSDGIKDIVKMYTEKYGIDYENTCAIFYRGNDKNRECDVTGYDEFIAQARQLPGTTKFLVQPDETEFLEAFTAAFPGRCFWFDETPHMKKKNSAIFFELPNESKLHHGRHFLAAVQAMAQCKYLITHSGNGGMWAVLLRGNMANVHQFLVTRHIYG